MSDMSETRDVDDLIDDALAPPQYVTDKPQPEAPIHIRLAGGDDLNFILKSWMVGFKNHSYAAVIDSQIFFPNHQKLIGDIAARPGCLALVAVDEHDHSQIMGFIVAEPANDKTKMPLIVHWMYVKKEFRRFGIGKKLLQYMGWHRGDVIAATHYNRELWIGTKRSLPNRYRVIYNPYLVFLKNPVLGWNHE